MATSADWGGGNDAGDGGRSGEGDHGCGQAGSASTHVFRSKAQGECKSLGAGAQQRKSWGGGEQRAERMLVCA